MPTDIVAYASLLTLSRKDVISLKLRDAYSLHKIVYGLFENRRTHEEDRSSPSGFLYVDQGSEFHDSHFRGRRILILSDRRPHFTPLCGTLVVKPVSSSFLAFDHYIFEVTVNPTKRDRNSGKIIPVTGYDAIRQWFSDRAVPSWGFSVSPDSLDVSNVGVQQFFKSGQRITHGCATLKGMLRVVDRERFIRSFKHGLGRGKAFGFGLLQIAPCPNT